MNLINPQEPGTEYASNRKLYYEHLMQQYTIYVDSAHKISARRNGANAFFLSLNTIILGILSGGLHPIGWAVKEPIAPWLAIFPIFLSGLWYFIIRSYRKLNTAKFKVIGELEQSLPSSPFWNAEWEMLSQGKKPWVHIPLTRLEQAVPLIFIAFYLVLIGTQIDVQALFGFIQSL